MVLKARAAKKLLKQFVSAELLTVPPGHFLFMRLPDDTPIEELATFRKFLDGFRAKYPLPPSIIMAGNVRLSVARAEPAESDPKWPSQPSDDKAPPS